PLPPQGLGIGWCLDTVFVCASSPELACNGDRFAQKPRIWFWIPEYTARCRSGIRCATTLRLPVVLAAACDEKADHDHYVGPCHSIPPSWSEETVSGEH